MISELDCAVLLPIPFTIEVPITKTLPYLFTNVVYSLAHETCLIFYKFIFVGLTSLCV